MHFPPSPVARSGNRSRISRRRRCRASARQDQHIRPGKQPLAEHDLLLVAARQVADELENARAADVDLLLVLGGDGKLCPWLMTPFARYAIQIGHRDVVLDLVFEDQAIALAVFGHVGNLVPDRLFHRAGYRLPCRSAAPFRDVLAVATPEDAHRQFGSPGAHQSGNPSTRHGAR